MSAQQPLDVVSAQRACPEGTPIGDGAHVPMQLLDFGGSESRSGPSAECRPVTSLRVEFGSAQHSDPLLEGAMVTLDEKQATEVAVYRGDLLVARGTLVHAHERVGVRLSQIVPSGEGVDAA